MTEPAGMPRTILLATDLSARCDRALDRAAQLAAQWAARLVVVHVVEPVAPPILDEDQPSWMQPADRLLLAERSLRADLPIDTLDLTTVVEEGDPAETVARVADEMGCQLIITGLARNETLGRFSLGTTVNRLLRRLTVPILVVKARARHEYSHILVATDLSDASKHGLEIALHWFPDRQIEVFHAYEAPFAGMMGDAVEYRRQHREAVAGECMDFLASVAMPPEFRSRLSMRMEYGTAPPLLRDHVDGGSVDLVVLGSQGRSAAVDVLFGSTANAILRAVNCDALVVRKPAAPPPDA